MSVIVIDYGMGNLGSVCRAIEECGMTVRVSDEPKEIRESSHIVLPGVGSFSDAMSELHGKGWVDEIKEAALADRIPLLGICLGMQLLADVGFEGGETEGLGLIPGQVVRLIPTVSEERIPHVGWNEVIVDKKSAIFNSISDRTDFYFVHSFQFIAAYVENIVGRTPYCGDFHSVVQKDNIVGVQFHPEKSQKSGFQLLRNFFEK